MLYKSEIVTPKQTIFIDAIIKIKKIQIYIFPMPIARLANKYRHFNKAIFSGSTLNNRVQ